MNLEKIDSIKEKILFEIKRFNITLKYGFGDQVTLKAGNKPMITNDGWLILLSDDNNEQKYIYLGSVYELILDVNVG